MLWCVLGACSHEGISASANLDVRVLRVRFMLRVKSEVECCVSGFSASARTFLSVEVAR